MRATIDSPGPEAGFSLIEALIATGILLMIAVGIIPLFATSILNNTRGADSMSATNYGRSQIETLEGMVLKQTPAVSVAAGQKQLVTSEYWTPGATNQINDSSEGWYAGTAPSGTLATWTRQTTVTEFGLSAVDDGFPSTDAQDGSATPMFTMIQVDLNSGKLSGILGNGERITMRMIRAY